MRIRIRTSRPKWRRRRWLGGFTLIEVLIVIAIMLMVTAAAIPIIAPALENRRLREASRLVASYIQGARSRAIQTGRSVGVRFERSNGLPFAMRLSYVEIPPPYSGDFVSSLVVLSIGPGGVSVTSFPSGDTGWQNLIRYGDYIRLNHSGKLYRLASVATGTDRKLGQLIDSPSSNQWYLFDSNGNLPILPAGFSSGVPFEIYRQPVRSSVAPLQLPEGTVVDIYNSATSMTNPGLGTLGYDPYFTFSPNGAIDYEAMDVTLRQRPIGPMLLLIGRRELMLDVSPSGLDENLSDAIPSNGNPKKLYLQNFWVKVDYQTGHVSTNPLAAYNTTSIDSLFQMNGLAPALQAVRPIVRGFAYEGQSVGGQ